MSVPSASGASPAASAAPEPPLDPPATSDGSRGLRTVPSASLIELKPHANSCVAVLPRTIAPASRTRRTASASRAGTWPANIAEPYVVTTPAVSKMSLTAIGTPSSGRAAPRPHAASAARASSAARSGHTAQKAPCGSDDDRGRELRHDLHRRAGARGVAREQLPGALGHRARRG